MAVYNLTSKEASLRDSEIIRFCNDSFHHVPTRNGIEPLKSMVRIQNKTSNAERIECPFYGDFIFSYKGNSNSIKWIRLGLKRQGFIKGDI